MSGRTGCDFSLTHSAPCPDIRLDYTHPSSNETHQDPNQPRSRGAWREQEDTELRGVTKAPVHENCCVGCSISSGQNYDYNENRGLLDRFVQVPVSLQM